MDIEQYRNELLRYLPEDKIEVSNILIDLIIEISKRDQMVKDLAGWKKIINGN